MKNYIVYMLLFLGSQTAKAQMVINDPHLWHQANRMVATSWGYFRPDPKYILGVQVNIHHTMVWGWLAPNQNGRYRKGPDIRPLAAHGMQTQRQALMLQQSLSSQKHREISDSIAKQAISELANYSGLTSGIDPLWQLYYKVVLKDIDNYDLTKFTTPLSPDEMRYLQDARLIEWLDNEMLILKEKLHVAFNTDMDRGDRIMNYHTIFLDYNKVRDKWYNYIDAAKMSISMRSKIRDYDPSKKEIPIPKEISKSFSQNDRQIVKRIMQNAQLNF